MEDIDSKATLELISEDDRLLMSQVICEEVDLFYMDCYLRELFLKEKIQDYRTCRKLFKRTYL